MIGNRAFAKKMRENPCKDPNGNIICSPVLWEQIARRIENSVFLFTHKDNDHPTEKGGEK